MKILFRFYLFVIVNNMFSPSKKYFIYRDPNI